MPEELVGRVINFYAKIMVAALEITARSIKIGDTISFLGATTDFQMQVTSMQEEHQQITEATAGQQIGIQVSERVRENDDVLKISS